MKKTLLVFAVIIGLSFVAEKQYVVKYEVKDWATKVQVLQAASAALKQSDLPAKSVNPLADSLTKFANEIVSQVNVQLNDTTTNKK